MLLRMYAFTLLEIKASLKTREKSHLTEQLNSPRVKEYTNALRLVLVLAKTLKKSSLVRARNFTHRFSKKLKY